MSSVDLMNREYAAEQNRALKKSLQPQLSDLIQRGELYDAEQLLLSSDLDTSSESLSCYNNLLAAYVQHQQISDAMDLLQLLHQDPTKPNPDVVSYNTCLSGLPPQEAETLLYETMIPMGCCQTWSFNIVMHAWLKQTIERPTQRPPNNNDKKIDNNNINRAVSVLHRLIQTPNCEPDLISFSTLIRVFGQRGMADEALHLLDTMKRRYQIHPDPIVATMVLQALKNAPHKSDRAKVDLAFSILAEMEARDARPDTATYNAVLSVLAHVGNRGPHAEQLLRRMQDNPAAAPPNVVTYAAVLTAWKNTEAGVLKEQQKEKDDTHRMIRPAEHAEMLLFEMLMHNLRPNTICFSTVLAALAKEGMAERAELILQRIEALANQPQSGGGGNDGFDHDEEGDHRPNIHSYTSIIEAWANSEAPHAFDRARAVLERIAPATTNSKGNTTATKIVVRPNVICYNTLIKVVERCDAVLDKVRAVQEMLQHMRQQRVSPNIRTYNAVFSAVSAIRDDERGSAFQAEGLEYTMELLKDLRNDTSLALDSYTYPTVLRVIANLTTTNRFVWIEPVVRSCCRDGWLDIPVLAHLKRMCSNSELKQMLQIRQLTDDDEEEDKHELQLQIQQFPYAWSRQRRRANIRKYGKRQNSSGGNSKRSSNNGRKQTNSNKKERHVKGS